MWDIRITNVADDKIEKMLSGFRKDAQIICVKEGAPFDEGIEPHVHIFTKTTSCESWVRKQIQQLALTRKGNELYSMKKSHENSPNYVCKKVYQECKTVNEIHGNKRILFKRNCDVELITLWRDQYQKYVEEIQAEQARSRSVRKKSSDNFSKLIVKEVVEFYRVEQGRPTPFEIVPKILKIYNENDKKLPTRNIMEILVLTIQMKLGQVHEVEEYYTKNFTRY